MDSYDYEFYERLRNLITVVRESEQQRLQLEWRLSEWNRPDMKKAKEKAARLQTHLRLMEEEDKISKERNADIKRRLNEMDTRLKEATLPDEKLHFLKRNCKNQLVQEHPNWKRYKEVLQSQLREALQKVNGISESYPVKMFQPECNTQPNVTRQSTMDQFAPSAPNEHNPSSRLQFAPSAPNEHNPSSRLQFAPSASNEHIPSSRLQFSQGMYQDPYVIPPEKPQRSLPRIYDEQLKTTNATKVFSPSMPSQTTNQFALQDHQQLQNGILQLSHATPPQQIQMRRLQNGLLPATIMPVGYPQQEPIMVQVPLGHNQEMQRVKPQEEVYFVPNNIQPSTFYQHFQDPQEIVIQEGETQMGVPESFASKALTEDPKEHKTDPKQESSTLLGANGNTAVDLEHPQPYQDKISEKLEAEIQEVHPQHQKSHISPETQYRHSPGNATATVENYVDYETSRKQNSFEDLLPLRALLSPEPQSRRMVLPVFSDIELTGDFESQIVYGKTPPVNPEMKLINDGRLVNASSEVKKGSVEAAAEDTDFGILSLPDNLLPATVAARASVSESGQRKTGDVTTTDGFDTGVSNSIPGIHLSHSLSNPEERSYISDFETENSPPLEVKDMKPTSHPSDVGMSSVSRRQSKKNLRRASSPVTPALSVEGLLLLMKMVEDSFQTVSCSKDEYYRSFQPSDEERGRIISEANNEGASTIDADPALVSMIILEQMTVIIRSLSTGCLLSDTLLQSENLMTLCERDIKSQLPLNTVTLWESLFVHFTSILKHKVMSPKEVAALFVPCLLQSGSICQEKAFKLLVQLLEHVNRNVLPSTMGIDELSDNSSDESPIAAPQRHEEQTMKDKQELVTSIQRAFSDGMDGDRAFSDGMDGDRAFSDGMDGDSRNLGQEIGKEESSELNISHTPAYKNMLFGFMGSISVEEDIGNSDSESDELEKEFGTSIPDPRQNINPTPNSTGKSTTSVTGVPPAKVPSTEDEDSRDYDFYD